MESLSIESFVRMTWQSTQRGAFNEGNAAAALGFSGYAENGVRTLIGVAGSSLKQYPLISANSYRFSPGIRHWAGGVARPALSASLAGTGTTITAPQASMFGTARFDQRAYIYLSLDSEVRNGLSDVGINIGAVLVS